MMICLREHKLFSEFFNIHLVLKDSLLLITVAKNEKNTQGNTHKHNMSNKKNSGGMIQGQRKGNNNNNNKNSHQIDEIEDNDNDNDNDNDLNVHLTAQQRISGLLNELSQLLYESVRPKIIHESDMGVLCDIIHILQTEIQEQLQNKYSTFTIHMTPRSFVSDYTDYISAFLLCFLFGTL